MSALWMAAVGAPPHDVFETAALLAPLGLSPLVGLAMLGGLAHFGHLDLPAHLNWLAWPVIWGLLGLAGLCLHMGKSSKFTRPFAETLGTGESLLAVVAAFSLFLGSGNPAKLSMAASPWFIGSVAALGLALVLVLRTAFDLLIWLSPIPLVDAGFELAKLLGTLGLALLVVVSPELALGVFVSLIVTALAALRWAWRTARRAIESWRSRTGPEPAAL